MGILVMLPYMVLALTVLYPICLYEVVMTTVSLLFGLLVVR